MALRTGLTSAMLTSAASVIGGALVLAAATGCSEDAGPTIVSDSNNGMNGDNNGTTVVPGCDGAVHLPSERVVLLENNQYLNVISDLIDPSVISADDRAVNSRNQLLRNGFGQIDALDSQERITRQAAQAVTGDKLNELAPCDGADPAACAQTAIEAFASKAFRRAPTADEMTGLMAAYQTGSAVSYERGIQTAVRAIMLAPSTLYRLEVGTPGADGSLQLDPYAVASELAFFLLDSMPDAELRQAADDGSLATPEGISAQVTRLLQLPRVRQTLTDMMLLAYKIGDVTGAEGAKEAQVFPDYSPATQQALYNETARFFSDVMWKPNGSMNELMTSNSAYVSELTAPIYGVAFPGGQGAQLIQLPADQRAGFLTQGSFLAAHGKKNGSSVVKRGLFIRKTLLCLTAPPPPTDPALLTRIQEQVGQLEGGASQADLAAQRAADPVCGGCHGTFDRFGLAFEKYDGIGQYIPAGDSQVDLSGLDPNFEGVQVADAVQLSQVLADDPGFTSCMARKVMAFAMSANEFIGSGMETDCGPLSVTESFTESGHSLETLIQSIVTTPAFSKRSPGEGQ